MEERFDYVTLIGVLEYAKAILERIIRIRNIWKDQSSLKTGRKILIAIENRLGLKYLPAAGKTMWAGNLPELKDIRGSILSRHSANRSWSRCCRKTVFEV